MTSAATSTPVPAPEQARRSWPWTALQGVVLVVLAVVGVLVADTGVRLMLAGVGVLGVLRGVGALRAARAGSVDRSVAVLGAGAAWLGAVAVGLALFPPLVAAWTCVVVLAGLLVALVVRARRRGVAGAAVALAAIALVVGAVSAGPTWLAAIAVLAVAVAVLGAGVAAIAGAVALRRLATQPEPAVPAACAGCACSAGGCGVLQRD